MWNQQIGFSLYSPDQSVIQVTQVHISSIYQNNDSCTRSAQAYHELPIIPRGIFTQKKPILTRLSQFKLWKHCQMGVCDMPSVSRMILTKVKPSFFVFFKIKPKHRQWEGRRGGRPLNSCGIPFIVSSSSSAGQRGYGDLHPQHGWALMDWW